MDDRPRDRANELMEELAEFLVGIFLEEHYPELARQRERIKPDGEQGVTDQK